MAHKRYTSGFTLMELMIALALGLLIVAAGLAVFLSSQRSLGLQSGMSELQQNAIFGLSTLTYDLRHVNLNTASTERIHNKDLPGSGIVFSTASLPVNFSGVNANLLTDQEKDTGGTDIASDQLTIQFVPQYTTGTGVDDKGNADDSDDEDAPISTSNMFNCEGRRIETVADISVTNPIKPVVVQRYYIAEMKKGTASYSPKRYALYCDAGWYDPDAGAGATIQELGANGQQIVQNVDAFKVLLGVQNKDKDMRYLSIDQYNTLMSTITDKADYWYVVSVNVAVIAHSSNPIGADSNINNDRVFNMFSSSGTSPYGVATLKTEQKTNSKFIREVFSQVVAFRNTLGGAWE